MRTLNQNQLLFIFAFICIALSSCKHGDTLPLEKTSTPHSTKQTVADANTMRNNIDNIIFNIVLGYDDLEDKGKTGAVEYKETIDPSPYEYPQTITIEYNRSAVQNGGIKKGKIIIFYNRPMYEPGSIASAYFDHFYINDTLVKGSMFTTNITRPKEDSCTVYDYSGTQSLIYANRAFRKYSIDRIFTQIDGNRTFAKDDDKFQISGSIKVYDEKKPAEQIAETNLNERNRWTISNPNVNITAVKENYDDKSYLDNADSEYSSKKNNSMLVDESDGNRFSKKQHIKLQSFHR